MAKVAIFCERHIRAVTHRKREKEGGCLYRIIIFLVTDVLTLRSVTTNSPEGRVCGICTLLLPWILWVIIVCPKVL